MKSGLNFSLNDQTLLITGGGTGIGKACAKAAAEAQAKTVLLCGRRPEPLDQAVSELQSLYPHTEFVGFAADITHPADRRKLVQMVQQKGSLDGLVNNAGLFYTAALGDTTDQTWQETFAVNVDSPFQLMRDFLPLLKASGGASIVNISSTLAIKPIPNSAAYNASKAALIQLTRSLALELAPSHIRVNCILPGIVETDMYRGRYSDAAAYEEGIKAAASLHPLGRIGRPEDIAQAVRFLLSADASWITGVALPVDGGMLVT